MKKYILITMIIALLTVTTAVYSADFENNTISGLNITNDVDLAFNASHDENKTLVIIFDQDSCYYCDMFKNDVLSNKDVQQQLNENYVVLIVDINENTDTAVKYQVFGTPSVKFIDPNGKEINGIEGYVDSSEFLKELKEI